MHVATWIETKIQRISSCSVSCSVLQNGSCSVRLIMESNEVAFFHTKVGEIVGLERGKMFNNEYLNDYYKVIMVLILLHEI